MWVPLFQLPQGAAREAPENARTRVDRIVKVVKWVDDVCVASERGSVDTDAVQ